MTALPLIRNAFCAPVKNVKTPRRPALQAGVGRRPIRLGHLCGVGGLGALGRLLARGTQTLPVGLGTGE